MLQTSVVAEHNELTGGCICFVFCSVSHSQLHQFSTKPVVHTLGIRAFISCTRIYIRIVESESPSSVPLPPAAPEPGHESRTPAAVPQEPTVTALTTFGSAVPVRLSAEGAPRVTATPSPQAQNSWQTLSSSRTGALPVLPHTLMHFQFCTRLKRFQFSTNPDCIETRIQ